MTSVGCQNKECNESQEKTDLNMCHKRRQKYIIILSVLWCNEFHLDSTHSYARNDTPK